MKTNWFKRTLCSILAFVMVLGYVPATAFASEADGLCEHHTQHTKECGYSPAVEGHECGHEHTEECYQSVTECVHSHGDCGYVPPVEGHDCDCQPDENGEIVHTEGCGYVEAVAEVLCGHVCSEESGCVTKTLNCQHKHDENCGFVEYSSEIPCNYTCSRCNDGSTFSADQEFGFATRTPVLTISGWREVTQISVGSNFGLRGTISTDCGIIEYVTGSILKPDGTVICTHTDTPETSTYDIQYGINKYLVFGTLSEGYYYIDIQAEANYYGVIGTQTLIHQQFVVGNPSTGAPTAPTNFTATYVDNERAFLSWSPSIGATSYEVQYWSPTNSSWLDDDSYSSGTSYTSKGLKNYSSWQFRVRAVNSVGASGWTNCSYNKSATTITGNCGINGTNLTYTLSSDGILTIRGNGAMADYTNVSPDGTMGTPSPWYSDRGKITRIIIESGVTSIGTWAFYNCTNATSVSIPSSVTTFGEAAFFGCSGLTEVTIPSSITELGNLIFAYCTSLSSISLPDNLQAIGDNAFMGCSQLNSVSIPHSVSLIGCGSFQGCTSLTSVNIPESVTSIVDWAFYECSSLKDVYYGGTEEQWSQISIGGNNSKLTNANIHFNSNGSSSELTLVSTSPAAGATNVALDSPLVLTFSEDIDPNLHWERGKIFFLDSNTSRTILEINSENSAQFGCTVDGSKLILSNVFLYEWFRLSESGKISVIIPQGVVEPLYPYNSSSGFMGILSADDYSFTLERHIISSGFTMGRDSFNFNNSEAAFGPRQYEFRNEDIDKLFSKCSATEKFILNASIKVDQMSQFSGNCFGMAALMALFANGQLDLLQMQPDAQCVFDVSLPKNNLAVRSYISCYNALQALVIPQIESKLGIKSQEELGVSLVSALIHSKKAIPLMVELEAGAVSGGWHAVVAYAIDIVSDPDNYIVYIADSNAFSRSVLFDGSPVLDDNSKMVTTYCPVLLYIRKNTYEISGTHALCPNIEEVGTSGICGNYKSLIWVVDNPSIFNKYSIQSSSGIEGGMCPPSQSVLRTDATTFQIKADGKEAVVSNGKISGSLSVAGPFYDANGLNSTQMQTFYIPFSTEYSITTDTSNSQTLLLRFGQSETASCVQGSINKVVFSVDRSLSISGASGETKLYLSADDDTAEETFAVCAKSLVPEATFYSVGKSYYLKTSEAIGEATITNYTGFESSHSTTVSTDGNEIKAYLQDQNNVEEIVVDNNTPSTIRINMPSGIIDSDEVWIDGVVCPVQSYGNGLYVTFPSANAHTMVTYSYNNPNAADVHTQYPTSMKVWKLKQENGAYTAEYVPEFDNLLQYSGSSIRITGNKGIRMITSVNQDTRNALTGNGLAGFKLLEYGTLLAQTSKLGDNPLVLGGGEYVKSNYAYKKGVADPVFKYTNGLIQYTNVLIGFTDEQCKEDIAMRPYMKLQDENGEEFIIYGGIVYRSIGYIAYQNRNAFQPRSAAYEYVWSIIHNVYGNQYDSEYKK